MPYRANRRAAWGSWPSPWRESSLLAGLPIGGGHRDRDVPNGQAALSATGKRPFGWAPPLLDGEASTFVGQAFQRADVFLFGTRARPSLPPPARTWGLDQVDLRSAPEGLTIQTYRTAGRPQYEAATA